MHLEVKQETEVHVLVGTVILGFLSIFKKSKASSPFEILNSVCLSRCQSHMMTLSSFLAWKHQRTEEPGGLQSMGLQRVRHD